LKCSHSYGSGQALLELAIFGSILLFCFGILIQYGLSLNYRQALQMITFRRAVDLSYNRSSRGVSDTNVNLVVIHDKSIPDPSDPYSIKNRSPYVHQASAVYSDKMYQSPYYSPDEQKSSTLPGVDYIVDDGTGEVWLTSSTAEYNGQPVTKLTRKVNPDDNTARSWDFTFAQIQDPQQRQQWINIAKNETSARVGYFTAGWGYAECCKKYKCKSYIQDENGNDTTDCAEEDRSECEEKNTFRRRKNNPNGPIFWEWEEGITCEQVSEGMDLDVDNDFVEESVVRIDKQEAQFDPDTGQQTAQAYTRGFGVLDPTQGDINNFYGKPNSLKKVVEPYIVNGKEKTQGLQSSYTKRIFTPEGKDSRIVRQEGDIEGQTKKGILNAEIVNNQETTTRTIVLNNNKNGYRALPETAPEDLEEKKVNSDFEQKEGKKYFTEF